jgi:glycosyltransferase involved in cell wall biosynthesis
MKISIVTSYYNRKKQFINTLETISKSSEINNTEIIAVDDASDDGERIEYLTNLYPFLKVIRVNKENKWWSNPSIPFNKAINESSGDVIILQNPECLHLGDILKNAKENINDTNYLSYSVYSINHSTTNKLSNLKYDENLFNQINEIIGQKNNVGFTGIGQECWYNHPIYRPCHYHFISAISRKNINILGGFDERYGYGCSYDDDEFLHRVKLLGLDLKIIDEVHGVHQWHNTYENRDFEFHNKELKNRDLFNNITKKLKSPEIKNQIL